MSLLTKVALSEIPEDIAPKISAVGTIGEVKEVEQGEYVAISFPIEYQDENGDDRRFTVRFRVKPEWTEGVVEEGFAYELNYKRLYRKLFATLEMDEADLDAIEGRAIGFTAGPQAGKNGDKSRQEIKSFYKPR